MNKTIFFLFVLILAALVVKFQAPQRDTNINENFQENKQKKYTLKLRGAVFRIFSRRLRASLQAAGGASAPVFSKAQSTDSLWTFFDGQIYSLHNGLYLAFDIKQKKLILRGSRPETHTWVYTSKGELQWIDKSTTKAHCVPDNTLENVDLEKKKCLEYSFYVEIVGRADFPSRPGQKIIYADLLEFP